MESGPSFPIEEPVVDEKQDQNHDMSIKHME